MLDNMVSMHNILEKNQIFLFLKTKIYIPLERLKKPFSFPSCSLQQLFSSIQEMFSSLGWNLFYSRFPGFAAEVIIDVLIMRGNRVS